MSKLIDRWENLMTTACTLVVLSLIGIGIPMCNAAEKARDLRRLECVQTIRVANDCKALFP